jgi:hypothetical protein
MTTMTANTEATPSLADLRREYARMRDAGRYEAGKAWDEAVQKLLDQVEGDPTPDDFLWAARTARTECNRCHGTGTYSWGGTINGKPVHTGDCYRCEGHGTQGQDDYHRCRTYDRHAIRRACGF